MAHWENAMDWETSGVDMDEEETSKPQRPDKQTPLGSYHCKSALRNHESNMKLFLYKKSFLKLSRLTSSPPYNDECLLLISDLWRCFYKRTHGLDRLIGDHHSKNDSIPSPAFAAWSDYTMKEIIRGDLVHDVLLQEMNIWQREYSYIIDYKNRIHKSIAESVRWLLNLTYFLNLGVMVLNYMKSSERPDIEVAIPGICKEEEEGVFSVMYNHKLKLMICGQCVRFITPIYDQILQKDVFLNIVDKINERMNVVIGARVISLLSVLGGKDESVSDTTLYREMISIIDWGDSVLIKHRNRGFDLLGKFEAYCVSAILTHDKNEIWNNKEFQQNLLNDDRDNQPDLYHDAKELCFILDGMDEQQLAEMHGLWRIWGHPLIDIEGGMKKMETTCLKQPNVDKSETAIGHRTFKLTFCKNYYRKHKHYPLNNVTHEQHYGQYSHHLTEEDKMTWERTRYRQEPTRYLLRCLREERVIDERNSLYDHKDWDQVTLLQSFQIPQSMNLATMIKDKAISMTRTELTESVMYRNSVFDSEKRRGVLKWLKEQAHKMRDYLGYIDKNGLPDDDSIIGLYPKERELKTKARFFSLMSYNMRMYITSTEELLGKYILPYFPMITMSDTLLNMIIRLYNMTTKIGASGSKVVYCMNIDFSKWNQNMRERTNDSIFRSIDRIFGFRRLISRTHSIFRNSYLYLCSGEYIPTIVQRALTTISPYSRVGDESGKEGLRQKGWTITTVCDIISLAFLHKVKIELIGGGDNQVLTVEISSPLKDACKDTEEQLINIQNRMIRFRNALAKKMEKRGLPLKLEETWISHRLLMYNKIMYLDGVPLKGRLKVISRMFSNSNEGVTSLGSITSTLGTGFQSLSAKDYTPILAWMISRILLMINLGQFYLFNPICGSRRLDKQILDVVANLGSGHTPFGKIIRNSEIRNKNLKKIENFSGNSTMSFESLYLICLYYHKVLGGPGIGTPFSYIMKGFPDPLSESLTFNYLIMSNAKKEYIRRIVKNLTLVESSSTKHWEHLLEDPVSINHNAPAHGIASLRQQAEEVLRSADIKNAEFKELIKLGDNEYLRKLSSLLCSGNNIEPRLMHDIAGSTIPGYVNTILSKVDQSTTLNKLASNKDVISSVYEQEMMYYLYLTNKARQEKGHELLECPTEMSRRLRDITWGKHIIGVTTPHPAGFLKLKEHSKEDYSCDQNYIGVHISRPWSEHSIKRGSSRPYFGSYTEEKFKTGILASAYGDEDLLKRAMKIQKLLGWRYMKDSFMYKMIQGILRCVTDADPDKFLPDIEEITGDVEHRYHDMATKHGGIPSNLIQLYTYASCNTSTFINHSKGAANETLHFQAAIIYSIMISTLRGQGELTCSKMYHYHECCSFCIQKIELSGDDKDIQGVSLMSCPGNKLMYIKEEDIPVHYHSNLAFIASQEKNKTAEGSMTDMEGTTNDIRRQTWLLLFASSIIVAYKSIKPSTVRLYLERLSIKEVLYLLRCLVKYSRMKDGNPTGQFDPSDVKEVILNYGDIISKLLSLDVMVDFWEENGMLPASADIYSDSVGWLMPTLHAAFEEDANIVKSAVVKYQDPFFAVGRLLLLMEMNPGTKVCSYCSDTIWKMSKVSQNTSCSVHGKLKTKMSYHLYSLDKLAKSTDFNMPESTKEEEEAMVNSRKRKRISLFESVKMMKEKKKRKNRRMLSSNLLYSNTVDPKLMKTIRCDWLSTTITSEDIPQDDTLISGVSFRPNLDIWDQLPDYVSDTIGTVQALNAIMKRHVLLRGAEEGSLSIGLEVDPDISCIPKYIKVLLLLGESLETTRLKITLRLFIGKYNVLEDLRFDVSEKIHAGYLKRGEEFMSRLSLIECGELQVDVNKISELSDIMVFRNWEGTKFCKKEFYCITTASAVYGYLDEYRKTRIMNHVVRLILPQESVMQDYRAILHLDPRGEGHDVSSSLVVETIYNHKPKLKSRGIDIMSAKLPNGINDSLVYSVYKTYVRVNVGITSEQMMQTICLQLGNGLKMDALKSNTSDPLAWKGILLVKMIIAIRVLGSKDRNETLSYYTQFKGMSYKQGSYNTVLLHRGRQFKNYKGYLINSTPGSVGSGLMDVVEEMATWLHVGWTGDGILSNKIALF